MWVSITEHELDSLKKYTLGSFFVSDVVERPLFLTVQERFFVREEYGATYLRRKLYGTNLTLVASNANANLSWTRARAYIVLHMKTTPV